MGLLCRANPRPVAVAIVTDGKVNLDHTEKARNNKWFRVNTYPNKYCVPDTVTLVDTTQ